MSKIIKLTQNQETIVDDDDYEKLIKYKWCANFNNKLQSFYVVRTENKKTILMHRFIMNPLKNFKVDHINHNTLDNRKENLRICTSQENCFNRQKHKNNTSGFIGVYSPDLKNRINKFRAIITFNYKRLTLGYFETAEEAAKAHDKKAKELFGEFAHLNNK